MKRIFLIGYMGAGKTTMGKALSARTGLTLIDLDQYIEKRYRKTIPQIFAEHGEEGFREIERNMLHEVAEFEDVLVSAGGGTPCFFDNMEFMGTSGTTVYLNVSVDELARRLETSKHPRPVLKGRKGEELKAFIKESLDGRRPYYEKATIIFNAEQMDTKLDVNVLADKLLAMI